MSDSSDTTVNDSSGTGPPNAISRNDLSGDLELPDGETVEVPRPDRVMPTLARLNASADVRVEQDRIRMREERECILELSCANKEIDKPVPQVASLYAGLSEEDEHIYAEIAFHTEEQIRELRDALDLLLRYRGGSDD